ncbi:MAG: EamA family transporter RarD [Actinobacteria bacterium]|nr:EamA family transporter RarD [Actinomycetota bacterium]NBY50702.1 EamA family transporter RarD [Actinomycetota bacterium]NDA36679.1 EamA family transporter RarD [Actinomycetota bacterium]NDC81935.1 EamA family transporter RarD [Actinomycetota bacterium]NDE50356.1 EamA family transporter RarD [Actinomycetota bacterium]
MTKFNKGLLFGVSAYIIWGLLPLYWKLVEEAGAYEILAHRGIWSLLICLSLLALRKQLKSAYVMVRSSRTLSLLFLASGLLTINWGVYIWSVTVNRVVEAALGYYITPLINVTFGVLLLREKLRSAQWIAVALAAAGVVILTLGYGSLPWIALVLAISWGSYSLIKKSLNLGALETLSLETLFAFIPNLVFLLIIESNGSAEFGSTWSISILLFGAGAATVIPLLLFNGSTTRLPLSTVGLLQYITPTIMFFIGIYINNEDISTTKVIGFAFIWIALAVLSRDLYRSSRPLDDGIAKAL